MKKIIIVSLVVMLSCIVSAQNDRAARRGNGTTNQAQKTQPQRGTGRQSQSTKPVQGEQYRSGGNGRGQGRGYQQQPVARQSYAGGHYGRPVKSVPRGGYYHQYGNHNYYCHDGRFYRPNNGVFVVCRPPIGAVIATSLINATLTAITIQAINSHRINTYFYGDGIFYYKDAPGRYRVVAPPIGARVPLLPYGTETLIIKGDCYYRVDDIYYRPVHNPYNGQQEYEVVGQSIR